MTAALGSARRFLLRASDMLASATCLRPTSELYPEFHSDSALNCFAHAPCADKNVITSAGPAHCAHYCWQCSRYDVSVQPADRCVRIQPNRVPSSLKTRYHGLSHTDFIVFVHGNPSACKRCQTLHKQRRGLLCVACLQLS